ncbi:MAG: hypothetical protein WBF37_06040 [Dehalococcoidia bacterium]
MAEQDEIKLPKQPPEPARGERVPALRPDDVRENPALRGRVIRAGVGALPAVWED